MKKGLLPIIVVGVLAFILYGWVKGFYNKAIGFFRKLSNKDF